MSELKITCPKCSNEIELTEQLAGPMLADLRASFSEELAKREEQAARTLAIAQEQAKDAAKAEVVAEQAALESRIKAQDEKLREAQKAQAAALKREQELKDKEAEMELTLQKMLAAERPALTEKLTREANEKAELKLAEQEQVMQGMKRQIEALKQKSEQGSMQTQGEAAEIVLEDIEPPLVCRSPRSKDTGSWERRRTEHAILTNCARERCGWFWITRQNTRADRRLYCRSLRRLGAAGTACASGSSSMRRIPANATA